MTSWRTSQLELGQENASLLLDVSKRLVDGSSSDVVVAVDLCLLAQLAHRQARRSVFAKCSHLWWTSCCPSPFHPTWFSPPASLEQRLQLWRWQKQAAGPSRFIHVCCWVVVLEPASSGIVRTNCVFVLIYLPHASVCKNKTKASFIFTLRQAFLIHPPRPAG